MTCPRPHSFQALPKGTNLARGRLHLPSSLLDTVTGDRRNSKGRTVPGGTLAWAPVSVVSCWAFPLWLPPVTAALALRSCSLNADWLGTVAIITRERTYISIRTVLTVCQAPFLQLIHVNSPQTHCRIDSINTPILQIRKLRHREVN